VTQAVETALREAGRDDVVDLVRKSGMRELEHELHLSKERIKALELEKVNWMTESGMFKALDERAAKSAVSLGKKIAVAAASAAGKAVLVAALSGAAGLIWWLIKIVSKGLHAP
jgi:ABC-type transport system involved in cytochrome bd biosynthesis fused ATPase/permease subunit